MAEALLYPNSYPSPLRVTTHVASGNINTAIDIKKLATYLEINDEINYIEFKNEDENIIKGSKNKKSNKKKKKGKGRFWNQITIIITPEPGFKNNIKIFNNGSISMTGVKKIENGKKSVEILIGYIKKIHKKVPDIIREQIPIDTLAMVTFKIALINSDYNISYNVNRSALHKILSLKYNVSSTFDACEYPGVNIKLFWNKNNITGNTFTGKCPCPKKCVGKGNGDGIGQCKIVTIFVFQSGSIMITGARCTEQIYSGYHFINSIFESYKDELEVKVPDFVRNTNKDKERRARKQKGIIYISKDKIVNKNDFESFKI
jgi:TATA-box binding protein (TBP) (component of TFIID and TFIIIB)